MAYQAAPPSGTLVIAAMIIPNPASADRREPTEGANSAQYGERASLTSGQEVSVCRPTKTQLLITSCAYLAIAGTGLAVALTADRNNGPGQLLAGASIAGGASVIYMAILRCYFGIRLCYGC
ncbi:MAG: hypothetical protein HY069_01735 [Chlamydiia bacterium]|nr:hypothetical protein [Chlamydiia bacterium]